MVTGNGGGGFFGAGNGNTTVSAGSEIKAETESSALDLGLTELKKGDWVMFEFPGFTTASAGVKRASLDELRHADDTSYYSDGHALWVKLVVAQSDTGRRGGGGGNPPGFGATNIRVSK
jgi:cell migration-inducing and hyaluronan-binding protein